MSTRVRKPINIITAYVALFSAILVLIGIAIMVKKENTSSAIPIDGTKYITPGKEVMEVVDVPEVGRCVIYRAHIWCEGEKSP